MKNFKRSISIMLVFIMAIALLTACGQTKAPSSSGGESGEKEIILRMSYSLPSNSPNDIAAQKFSELVSEATGGRIKIELHPNCGLSGGDLVKAFEMLIAGDIDIHGSAPITAANFDPRFNAFWLPWLFDDVDSLLSALDNGLIDLASSWSEEKGMMVLTCSYAGSRQLSNSKRDVKTVDDMKDLVIRVPAVNMFIDMFTELGSSPVAMDFSEVYTASQQGTIDGQENPLSTYASATLYEVQKHVTMYNMVLDTTFWFMNSKKFNSLSEEDQKILLDSAKEASEYYKELVLEQDAALEKSLAEEHGVTVTYLTDEELQPFRDKAKVVYEKYGPIIGQDIVDTFLELAGK